MGQVGVFFRPFFGEFPELLGGIDTESSSFSNWTGVEGEDVQVERGAREGAREMGLSFEQSQEPAQQHPEANEWKKRKKEKTHSTRTDVDNVSRPVRLLRPTG